MTFPHEAALVQAVREAGAVLRSKWPGNPANAKGSLYQEIKSDGSIVTEADFASNEIIVSALHHLFPEDGILSEEIPADAKLRSMSRVWILDPLDGTAHFANGLDDYSILLGLSEDTRPRFGIMYFPERDLLAIGEAGKQTTVNGSPVHVSSSLQLGESSVYVRNCQILPKYSSIRGADELDSGAAQFALCCGELDGAVIKMVCHKEWDVAAPIVVLQGSGAKVTDEKGQPLLLNQGERSFRYIIASNGLVHDELLKIVQESDTGD